MTSGLADLADVTPRQVVGELSVGELSVLRPQASNPVGLMTGRRGPRENCTVPILLCPDYVIRRPVYKSDPLYGLDLSLLLKGLTLQRSNPTKGILSLGSTPVLLSPGSAPGRTLTGTSASSTEGKGDMAAGVVDMFTVHFLSGIVL